MSILMSDSRRSTRKAGTDGAEAKPPKPKRERMIVDTTPDLRLAITLRAAELTKERLRAVAEYEVVNEILTAALKDELRRIESSRK